MESADEAPAPVKKTVGHCERSGKDSLSEQGEKIAFEERCIDATMRLTFAMSPAVVLLVQNLDCPVMIWDRLEKQY